MWKTIPNYNKYEISTNSDVRHRKHRHILKTGKPPNGYLQVGVYNDLKGKRISKCVHQLMALTFLGKKPWGYEVDHIDKNKTNNNLSNLRYIHWTKNKPQKPKPINICLVCGRKTTNKLFCSKECLRFYSKILVECAYCGKQFYRRKGNLKARTKERGYTNGKIFCSQKCNGRYHKKEFCPS